MVDWIVRLVESGGYLMIAALMFLENVFPPIPSELIMPLGGFTARRGLLDLWGVIAAGSAGSLLGQLPLYYLGRSVARRGVPRWLRWTGLAEADLDRARGWFRRYGVWAVLLCRFVPGVRSLVSIPAGAGQLRLLPFLGLSALGVTAWSALLAVAGYLLESQYNKVDKILGPAAWVVVIALLLVGVLFVVRRRWASRRMATE